MRRGVMGKDLMRGNDTGEGIMRRGVMGEDLIIVILPFPCLIKRKCSVPWSVTLNIKQVLRMRGGTSREIDICETLLGFLQFLHPSSIFIVSSNI